ncbi:DNA-directed RNA polymerase subunit omega [Alteracholeplasma palmae J233]|uniref:DNA-directed RNA polymerase subunit omega n=1 Tax=Alteracholeplasma palmae (strain ATCC 49389 / J233) TaxID=1318466 RepID=U4KLA6_ALTPJ|nr:DNA-directed RNA polymerase subunit omega [Alteracholeplasma palmae]CCV64563.1 DNA-directed RNA polymerase subunit omega [Alteracholeplasma palmae J233]
MARNKEGLRYPSIDKLLDKIDSKYKLVYAASKVAHMIEEENLDVDADSVKSVGKALEEILDDRVEVTFK